MRLGLLAGVTLALTWTSAAPAATINVSSVASGGMTDGAQAGNCNLREAIRAQHQPGRGRLPRGL